MKYFKLYWLHILYFILFLAFIVVSVKSVVITQINQLEYLKESYNKHCIDITEEKRNTCEEWKIEIENGGNSGFLLYQETITNKYFPKGIMQVLLILIPSCYFITKYFRERIILYENNRRGYANNLLRVFKNSYILALIPSILLFFAFLFYYKYIGGFNIMAHEVKSIGWSYITKPWLFILVYLINLILTNLIYINISILISRKYHNYFISVILSFLVIIGLQLFLEIVMDGIICGIILHSEFGIIFNIINAIPFNDSYGLVWPLVFSLSMNLIIIFIIYLVYKNKEKLIIDCEKNS